MCQNPTIHVFWYKNMILLKILASSVLEVSETGLSSEDGFSRVRHPDTSWRRIRWCSPKWPAYRYRCTQKCLLFNKHEIFNTKPTMVKVYRRTDTKNTNAKENLELSTHGIWTHKQRIEAWGCWHKRKEAVTRMFEIKW